MEQADLEEGEITDSDDETQEINANAASSDTAPSTSEYSLLPRPTNPAMSYRVPQESLGLPPAHTFRDSPADAADDSDADSEDSEQEPVMEKRPKLQPNVKPSAPPPAKKRHVWSDVLLEQQLSSKVKTGAITAEDAADTVERGVESYRPSGDSRTVTLEEFDAEQGAGHGELWDVNDDGEALDTVKKRTGKKRSAKERLDYDYVEDGFDDYHYNDYLPDDVCPEDDERVIARYIARNLNEPKAVLIERVTRFAGRKKALELFNATMDVEAAGGMMTNRGDIRRTPGGVFLQLLKKDKGVSKETVKDIFAIERENQKFAKKVFIKEKQIRKRKYYSKGTDQSATVTSASDTQMETASDLNLNEEPDIEIGVAT